MSAFNIDKLIRPHLKDLVPYSSARDDFKGAASVYLDANENPFDNGLNRYPDPHQSELKKELSRIKNIAAQNIFIGNGSDEAIDLLFRAFCEPGKDNIITLPPTYGMYKVSARINNVVVKEVLLDEFFDIDVAKTIAAIDTNTKFVFLCSPNNPTGNSLSRDTIKKILANFNGLVVIDEAYIDFSSLPSLTEWIQDFPNLVVLQTLSKAWGLASARIGLCLASEPVIDILNKIKPPYNISGPDQQQALQTLEIEAAMKERVEQIKTQRQWLINELNKILKVVFTVYPSDANFLLVKVTDANRAYQFLSNAGIIVRNRSKEPNCESCLRITVGTEAENQLLIQKLKEYAKNIIP
jgi:histidinol-phosphate aminotransferase